MSETTSEANTFPGGEESQKPKSPIPFTQHEQPQTPLPSFTPIMRTREKNIRDGDPTNLVYKGEFGMLPALRRPGYNTTGKEIEILVNAYPILKWPTKPVYQYEVSYFSYTHRATRLEMQKMLMHQDR